MVEEGRNDDDQGHAGKDSADDESDDGRFLVTAVSTAITVIPVVWDPWEDCACNVGGTGERGAYDARV